MISAEMDFGGLTRLLSLYRDETSWTKRSVQSVDV